MPTVEDARMGSITHLPDAVALAAISRAAARVPDRAYVSRDLGLHGLPVADHARNGALPMLLVSLPGFEILTQPGTWREVSFGDLEYAGVRIGPWKARVTLLHRYHLPPAATEAPLHEGMEPDALRARLGQDIDLLPSTLVVGRGSGIDGLSYDLADQTLGPLGMGLTLACIHAHEAYGPHCPSGLVTEVQWLASPLGTSHVFLFHLAVTRPLPTQDPT